MSAVQSLRASYICTGILLTLEGFLFLLFPHVATKLLMVAPLRTAQAEQYARAVGLGIAIVGYYYIVAGKYTLLDFYRASVTGRLFALPIISALVYFCSIEVQFLIFGVQDLVTAFWSYTALKAYDMEQASAKK